MGGAFCFALIFGGDLKAGLAAAAAGVAANAYLLFCGRHGVGGGVRTLSTAALIGRIRGERSERADRGETDDRKPPRQSGSD